VATEAEAVVKQVALAAQEAAAQAIVAPAVEPEHPARDMPVARGLLVHRILVVVVAVQVRPALEVLLVATD
jgi:hypothetical protein